MASSTSHDGLVRVRPLGDAERQVSRDPRLAGQLRLVEPATPRGLSPHLLQVARQELSEGGGAARVPLLGPVLELDDDESWVAAALAELSFASRGMACTEDRVASVRAALALAIDGVIAVNSAAFGPDSGSGSGSGLLPAALRGTPGASVALSACAWWAVRGGATEDVSWDLARALLDLEPGVGGRTGAPRLNCVSLSVFVVLCARRAALRTAAGAAWPLELRSTWAHTFVVPAAGPCASGLVFESLHSAWYTRGAWERLLELLGDFRPGAGLAGCRGLVETRTVRGIARVACGAACAWALGRGDARSARRVVDWGVAHAGAADSNDPWIIFSRVSTGRESRQSAARRVGRMRKTVALHHARALRLLAPPQGEPDL